MHASVYSWTLLAFIIHDFGASYQAEHDRLLPLPVIYGSRLSCKALGNHLGQDMRNDNCEGHHLVDIA